jgi:hypothetical protein
VARSGTLLRIQRIDPFRSEAEEKDSTPKISYNGLAFAKFRILGMQRREGVLLGTVRIYSDELSA